MRCRRYFLIARRAFAVAVAAVLLMAPGAGWAQPAKRPPRVGVLRLGTLPPSAQQAFREGLRDLGYVEGQNIVLEYGLAPSVSELPRVAAELVRLPVDVLVASGTASVMPARDATRTIPVVFVAAIDPVATGVVASLARPGGHVTGVSADQAALTGKRMELLRELLPGLARVALLVRDPSPDTAACIRVAEDAARTLGTPLQVLRVRDPGDLEGAFGAARSAGAMVLASDALFTAHRTQIAALALRHRLPTAFGLGEMVEAGGSWLTGRAWPTSIDSPPPRSTRS